MLAEIDEAGEIQVRYVYGDDLIKQTRSANDSYYLYDGHGSTRAMTDALGSITDTYDYDAYGTLIDSTGTTENHYLYTGEQFDGSLDNYYLRARYYNYAIGRFMSMDSWAGVNSDPVTLNKYLYGNSDPVNNVDPSGKFSIGSLMAAINVASSLVTIAQTVSDAAGIGGSGLDLQDIAIIAGTVVAGGAAFKVIGAIAKKRKFAGAKSKPDKKAIVGLGKFPKLSNGMNNREVGFAIKWGTAEKGARNALRRGISRADIQRMKDSGLTKKDIENLRNFYRDFQKVLDQTIRKGKDNTPKFRAKLMKKILKKWDKY